MRSACLRFSETQLEAFQAGERQSHRVSLSVPERDVLASVGALLDIHPHVAWWKRMSTGAASYRDRNGNARFVRFGFPGLSDIIGQLKRRPGEPIGAFLAIETKRAKEKATDEQAAFLEVIRACGGCAGVAYSAEDANRLIEHFWAAA